MKIFCAKVTEGVYVVYLQQAIKIYGVGIEKSKEELGRVLKKYEIEEVETGGIRTVFEKFEFSKI